MPSVLQEAIDHYRRLGFVTIREDGILWTGDRPKSGVSKSGLDLGTLPTFADQDPKVSLRHDKYLYGRGRAGPKRIA